MTELAALNVRINGDSSGLAAAATQAQASLGQIRGSAAAAQGGLGGFNRTLSEMGRNAGLQRSPLKNLSFQIADIAIQLQAGQRASTVFAQQGSQILAAFGPVGAVLGALAAVTIPMLAYAFSDTAESTKAATVEVNSLVEATRKLRIEAEALKLGVDEPEIEATKRLYQALNDIKVAQEAIRLSGTDQALIGAFQKKLALAIQERDAANRSLQTYRQLRDMVAQLTREKAAQEAKQQHINDMAIAWARDTKAVLDAARTIAGLDMSGPFSNAQQAAAGLLGIVNAIVGRMSAIASNSFQPDPNAPGVRPQRAPNDIDFGLPSGGGGGGSSGGGGGVNPIIAELDSVRQALMSQEELQIASFARQQETLRAALEQRLITQQEFAALMEDAQRTHAETMSGIDAYRYGDGLQKAGAFFGDMAAAFSSSNDKMARAARVFGAVEATINAWRAYTQTLADPSLPFLAKFAAAASVLGAGLGAAQAIKGGGGGGGGRGASAATAQASAPPVQRVLIDYNGPSSAMGSFEGLVNMINEAGKRGYLLDASIVGRA